MNQKTEIDPNSKRILALEVQFQGLIKAKEVFLQTIGSLNGAFHKEMLEKLAELEVRIEKLEGG